MIHLSIPEVKYRIRKRITSAEREARTAAFLHDTATDPLRSLLFAPNQGEPFAALHSLIDPTW